jgi:hypothetical protein
LVKECKIKDRTILEEVKMLVIEVDHNKQAQCIAINTKSNSKIQKLAGIQKRIFNSCHADGHTLDGNMFNVIQLKPNSLVLQTELTLSVSKKMVKKTARDMT